MKKKKKKEQEKEEKREEKIEGTKRKREKNAKKILGKSRGIDTKLRILFEKSACTASEGCQDKKEGKPGLLQKTVWIETGANLSLHKH